MNMMCRVAMLSLVASSVGVVADAQQGAQPERQYAWDYALQKQSSPPGPVTYTAQDVPLEHALREVARQAGLSLAFNKSTTQLDQRVSASFRDVSLDVALGTLLKDTRLEGRVSPDGKSLVIVRKVVETAQVNGVISGRVVHAKTKQPVVGASVSIGNTTTLATTGDDGTFRISAPSGEQTILVRAVGFTRQSKKVQVTEDGSITVEIVLEPSASVLDEVIVTGTVVATERKAIPTPITVITAEDIERRGITRIDQFFRGEVPGVFALEMGSAVYSNELGASAITEMYSRGSSGLNGEANPLKTYIDGVELADPSYLGTIDPRSIERIEIITGPQAATIYGSGAMGGVMQIFTKRGSGTSTADVNLTLKYGLLQSNLSDGLTPQHNHTFSVAGGVGARGSYTATGSYDYTGQWQPKLFRRQYSGSAGLTHSNDVITVSGSVSGVYASNGVLAIQGYHNGISWGSPIQIERGQSGEWRHYGTFGARRTSTSSSLLLSMNVDYRPMSVWQHHLTVGRSQVELGLVPFSPQYGWLADTLFNKGASITKRTSMSYNSTFTPQFHPSISSSLVMGANVSSGGALSVNGATKTKTTTTFEDPTVSQSVVGNPWGAFGSLQVGFFDHLYVTAGLRMEQNSAYGRDRRLNFTPTNGVTYAFSMGELTAKIMASYGRSTRPPSPDMRLAVMSRVSGFSPAEYISRLANDELEAEYESGPQGGIELYYGNLASISVNRYRQDVSNLIRLVNADSILALYMQSGESYYLDQNRYENVGTIRKHGWESTATLQLGSISLKGTYSWNDARIVALRWRKNENPRFKIGDSFYGTPTHVGNVVVGYSYGRTNVNIVTNFVGKAAITGSYLPLSYEMGLSRISTYTSRAIYPSFARFTRDGYAKSNLAASHRLNDWITATLNINNLGNSFATETTLISPSLGRITTLGLSFRPRLRR